MTRKIHIDGDFDFVEARAFIRKIRDERRNDEHWKHVRDMFEGRCHVCAGHVIPEIRSFSNVEHVWQMTCEHCGHFVEVSCDVEGCVIE